MKTQEKFDDERIALSQRTTELEEELRVLIQKHVDYMYTRERTHNMQCQ